MRPNWPRIITLLAVLAMVSGLLWGAAVIWANVTKQPLPMDDQCRAEANGGTVTLTLEQARSATIITSVALRRGLPARAVTIALATAYQESGIRNLDYGHADSVGLFQQRPSKGWGSVKQIMDPYYSSAKFYDALVRVKNWRTGDVNDVAQAVQRSAHPEAYRKHVSKARVLSSVLTGATPGGFSCKVGSPGKADADGLNDLLSKAFSGRVESSTGWACCRCVRPGITAPRCASACVASASITIRRSAANDPSSERRYSRTRVAIWSLRERPARSRPPNSGPTRSISPRSSDPCTSSSVGAAT